VMAHGLAQHGECRACRCDGSSRVDLLQSHDVGIMMDYGIDYARQIETAVGANPTVDVPGHHADGSAAVQLPRLRARKTKACAPIDTASQASTASKKNSTLIGVGSVKILQI
jgi:hypothetical protein